MQPYISVIIPTHNRVKVLRRAVDSVLGQSYSRWELIVVDDGSTDDTSLYLNELASHPKVACLRHENAGVSSARNRGVERAQGEWIAFLDSDDEWLPQKLELQVECLHQNSGHMITHGEEIWIRNGVRVNPMKKHQKSGGDLFERSLQLCCISPSTVMIHRSVFDEVGAFREDFPVCEDYDLWLRITSRYPVAYTREFLIKKYGGAQDQLSRRYKAMDYWRIKAIAHCLESNALNVKQVQLAKQELVKKARILLKGYRKHQNLSNFDEVFALSRLDGAKVCPCKILDKTTL